MRLRSPVNAPVASWPDFRLRDLLRRLVGGGVDFVVVGGVAVIVQAQPRFTKDLDICYAPDAANLEALGGVLIGLNAKLRGVDEDLPFVPDARALSRTQMLTLSTDLGGLDLLVDPPGSPGWDRLRRNAERISVDGTPVLVAALDDMLAMKLAAHRPQDLIDVEALEVARELRDRRRRS